MILRVFQISGVIRAWPSRLRTESAGLLHHRLPGSRQGGCRGSHQQARMTHRHGIHGSEWSMRGKSASPINVERLAGRWKVSRATAYRRARAMGLQLRPVHYKNTPPSQILAELRRKQFEQFKPDLSIPELAQRLSLSPSNAAIWAHRLGYEFTPLTGSLSKASKRRQAKIAKLKGLPPGLTRQQIATRLRVSLGTVQILIHQIKYRFRTAYPWQKIWPEQWQEVDWSLTDRQIAQQLKVTSACVAHGRKRWQPR